MYSEVRPRVKTVPNGMRAGISEREKPDVPRSADEALYRINPILGTRMRRAFVRVCSRMSALHSQNYLRARTELSQYEVVSGLLTVHGDPIEEATH